MQRDLRRVLIAQAVCAAGLAVLVLLATAALSGLPAVTDIGIARALSSGFGALLGMLATVATARSVLKSARAATQHPDSQLGLLPIYSGLLLKLLIVAGGVFFGLVVLQLAPLFVVLGYLIVHIGYLRVARSEE